LSQVSIIDIEGNHPEIPTQFDANIGFAIPIGNVLEILGNTSAAGTTPVHTEGSGNTITTFVQRSQAIAATDATKIGLSAFDSSNFNVDANGFVSLKGGSLAIDSIGVDTSTAPGTNPVMPDVNGLITVTGAQVVSSTVGANVIRSNSIAANTFRLEIQQSGSSAAGNTTLNGVAHFNSAQFSVSSGFVSLLGGGEAIDSIAVQTGTSPVIPTAAGLITINGAVVAAGTNPVRSDGTAANTLAIEVQISQAIAGADATKIGLSNFSSTDFAVAATGFVTLSTTGAGKTITGNSGGALSPTANNWNILGAIAAAGTSPVTTSGAVSTLTVNVQTSQALAAADATKIGLSNFDSTSFAVAATGFVTLSTTGAGKTITGDSGGALSPTANNWNILGLSGSKTSGSGSTLTIKSPPFSQVGASATSSLNTGEFVTAAVTRTLPASAGLIDGDLFIYVCTTANALVIQAVTAQKIRIGSLISSAAGTATSTAIGDSVTLRFNATDGFFYAVSSIGTWVLA